MAPISATRPWYGVDLFVAEPLLTTSPSGIEAQEAARRLTSYGPNEIEREARTPWWRALLYQFTDPLIYILIVAAVVTLIIQDCTDAGVIMAAVLLNAVVGYTQERRAGQAMLALAGLNAP